MNTYLILLPQLLSAQIIECTHAELYVVVGILHSRQTNTQATELYTAPGTIWISSNRVSRFYDPGNSG